MRKPVVGRNHCVFHREEAGEDRTVTAQVRRGKLEAWETTMGDYTELFFDAVFHARHLTVPKRQAPLALEALGLHEGEWEEGMVSFFGGGATFLSDLLEKLDAAGVDYTCTEYAV